MSTNSVITLYKTRYDMAGLDTLFDPKKSVCGHCGNKFRPKNLRFSRFGTALCPKCFLEERGIIRKIEP